VLFTFDTWQSEPINATTESSEGHASDFQLHTWPTRILLWKSGDPSVCGKQDWFPAFSVYSRHYKRNACLSNLPERSAHQNMTIITLFLILLIGESVSGWFMARIPYPEVTSPGRASGPITYRKTQGIPCLPNHECAPSYFSVPKVQHDQDENPWSGGQARTRSPSSAYVSDAAGISQRYVRSAPIGSMFCLLLPQNTHCCHCWKRIPTALRPQC